MENQPFHDEVLYTAKDHRTQLPALTTLLYRVCDNDPGTFDKAAYTIINIIDSYERMVEEFDLSREKIIELNFVLKAFLNKCEEKALHGR